MSSSSPLGNPSHIGGMDVRQSNQPESVPQEHNVGDVLNGNAPSMLSDIPEINTASSSSSSSSKTSMREKMGETVKNRWNESWGKYLSGVALGLVKSTYWIAKESFGDLLKNAKKSDMAESSQNLDHQFGVRFSNPGETIGSKSMELGARAQEALKNNAVTNYEARIVGSLVPKEQCKELAQKLMKENNVDLVLLKQGEGGKVLCFSKSNSAAAISIGNAVYLDDHPELNPHEIDDFVTFVEIPSSAPSTPSTNLLKRASALFSSKPKVAAEDTSLNANPLSSPTLNYNLNNRTQSILFGRGSPLNTPSNESIQSGESSSRPRSRSITENLLSKVASIASPSTPATTIGSVQAPPTSYDAPFREANLNYETHFVEEDATEEQCLALAHKLMSEKGLEALVIVKPPEDGNPGFAQTYFDKSKMEIFLTASDVTDAFEAASKFTKKTTPKPLEISKTTVEVESDEPKKTLTERIKSLRAPSVEKEATLLASEPDPIPLSIMNPGIIPTKRSTAIPLDSPTPKKSILEPLASLYKPRTPEYKPRIPDIMATTPYLNKLTQNALSDLQNTLNGKKATVLKINVHRESEEDCLQLAKHTMKANNSSAVFLISSDGDPKSVVFDQFSKVWIFLAKGTPQEEAIRVAEEIILSEISIKDVDREDILANAKNLIEIRTL